MLEINDESRVPELIEQLEILSESIINIGILSKESSEILLIAFVNEYGWEITVTQKQRGFLHHQGLHVGQTIKIPERSYIRSGYDTNKARIDQAMDSLYIKVMNFEITADQALNQLGAAVVGMIQDFMTDLDKPSNHPYTIDKKESSNPLIGKGTLRSRISYEIKRG